MKPQRATKKTFPKPKRPTGQLKIPARPIPTIQPRPIPNKPARPTRRYA